MSRDQNKKERRKLFTLNKDTYTTTCTVSHRKVLQPFVKATDFIDSTLSCADPSWLHLWVAVFQQEIRNWIQKQTRKKKIEKDAISKNLSKKKNRKKRSPPTRPMVFPLKPVTHWYFKAAAVKARSTSSSAKRCAAVRSRGSKIRSRDKSSIKMSSSRLRTSTTKSPAKHTKVGRL